MQWIVYYNSAFTGILYTVVTVPLTWGSQNLRMRETFRHIYTPAALELTGVYYKVQIYFYIKSSCLTTQ